MEASLLKDMLDALTAEGSIDAKTVQTEALRLYLNTHPSMELDGAISLWWQGRISLAKAAEIIGLTVPELKEVLAVRGVLRETEGKSRAEMDVKLHETLP
jgi:predicted HTH domain antitoxin